MSKKNICKKCGKDFLIIHLEERFYERKRLSLPDNCPECRRHGRESLRNDRTLFNGHCAKCGTDIRTAYPPDGEETVYCEKCLHSFHIAIE